MLLKEKKIHPPKAARLKIGRTQVEFADFTQLGKATIQRDWQVTLSCHPDESYSRLDSPDERLRTITLLQQKAKTLEAEIAKRDAFISMASHELKTPVTSLKGFIYLLQRHWSPQAEPQTRLFLDRMETQILTLPDAMNPGNRAQFD